MRKFLLATLTLTLTLASLTACSDTTPAASAPVSLDQISSNISNVVATDPTMTSVHIRHAGNKDDITVFAMATDIKEIVAAARRHDLMPNTERVRFLVYTTFSDAYGNTSVEPVIGLMFKTDELLKINFASKAFTEFDLINLYDDVWRRSDMRYSQNAIQAYCQKHGSRTQNFCGKESF